MGLLVFVPVDSQLPLCPRPWYSLRNEAIRGVILVSSLSLGRRLQNYGLFFLASGHWKESVYPQERTRKHELTVSGAPPPQRVEACSQRPRVSRRDR